ncbi:MAG: D-aminoacyl-tRNA deacylase [Acidimicrobiia bacterium]
MRAVVQRVTRATVSVDEAVFSSIGPGLLVLVGVALDDTDVDAKAIAAKLVGLRIFPDDDKAMNLSVAEIGGSILVVSQFTLYADARRGRRPSFASAAPAALAEPLVEQMIEEIAQLGIGVQGGRFGARMAVEMVNDGPVTIILETRDGRLT